MKKSLAALLFTCGLLSASTAQAITFQEVFAQYGCRLVCDNPAACTPGTQVWASLQFNAQDCVAAAAPASVPLLQFGALELIYGGQSIANCQGGACWWR